jgi:PAS domain-containing protein
MSQSHALRQADVTREMTADVTLEMTGDVSAHLSAHLADLERSALLARLRQEAVEKAAILDQMTDAVLVTDEAGRVVLSNAAARALFDVMDDAWPDLPGNS